MRSLLEASQKSERKIDCGELTLGWVTRFLFILNRFTDTSPDKEQLIQFIIGCQHAGIGAPIDHLLKNHTLCNSADLFERLRNLLGHGKDWGRNGRPLVRTDMHRLIDFALHRGNMSEINALRQLS